MARLGATGQMAEEVDHSLEFSGQYVDTIVNNLHALLENYEKRNILIIANKVYVQQGFELKKTYNKLLANKFFSSSENTDFSPVLINANTLHSETRLMLLSAIYFKCDWQKSFNLKYTKEEPFFTIETKSKNVAMMFKTSFSEYGSLDELQTTAARLVYAF
ncbi:leukocyte elastase inhibitor-like [Stomoxys calcitrans]|uniref:leukocyte elastase inhibitor-like n=1 Tax=Stomoxys calcitrans TaxID=35570 RepID=UPI0027E27AB3|nr:leukocyte elastase inhibitor-like [Stomoxys calcitrans]